MPITVDLYSDTQTRPTPAMRRAMAEAEVGDEQHGEDPTVRHLEEMVAELLGKEAAVFLPSGTMCNEIAFLVHCHAGDELILDYTSHAVVNEGGGPALLARAMVRTIHGDGGIFTADQVRAALRPINRYAPRSRAVVIEQTANYGGGTIWPLATIREVSDVAHQHGLLAHMDGARLMNAVVSSGVSARAQCATLDTAWIDLSKGLGAPVGAVLAGSRDFITAAWRFKQMIGGAMRQAGIIAAAGVYALEHHVDRLADDHTNARRLAEGLVGLPGIAVDPGRVQTNMVFFDVADTGLTAVEFDARLQQHGVRCSLPGRTLLRAVTHLDVDAAGIERAIAAARSVTAEAHLA
ncbi:MAG: threonine aldolase family protein [Chloroflexi bacterium]|nr:threonine aldolase family protein [Chloroflexota bacterium]